MKADDTTLASLLTFTRDGEWGKGEPTEGYSLAQVIRGTDFERIRLGDLSTLPLRYIRSDILGRKEIFSGDTLIETAGGTKDQPTGRSVFITQTIIDRAEYPLVCASFARFLRPNKNEVIPEFLFWKLQDEYNSRRMMPYHIQHTGVARFQYTQFAATYELPLPSKDIQIKVANLLGAIDDKIELNRRMNETLEVMARAVFQDWFVDFGPTRRKAAGETDPVAILGGLLPDPTEAAKLAALFPDSFGGKGLPEGWGGTSLGEVGLDLESGRRPKGGIDKGLASGVPSVGAESIYGVGRFDYSKVKFVNEEFARSISSGWVQPYDVAIYKDGANVGDPSRVALFGSKFPFEKFMVNEHVFLLRSKELGQAFLYLLMQSYQVSDRLEKLGKAKAAQPGLNQGEVKSCRFTFPGPALCEAFGNLVMPWMDLGLHNGTENQTLAATRNLLLPKLMSGEICLKDAEGAV
ncbi:restriction endonuclease subunit S [Sulfitobacter sp. CW3]|uniref:restriction endonuclease subunit S n=1 Tax=Sulfitobacter sp. CW3 TaxID=2861965 RepID=UPI001C5EBEE6|nr:restriction endonuclease subunit S [Sulfitobacter sp. CW3]MBW4964059.1 restriction endonuclease subunit S [Sulfitobacter sp. CW3]